MSNWQLGSNPYTDADLISNRDPDDGRYKKARLDKAFLYVIGRADGPVKVGISSRPERRLSSIQSGCHFPITVLHTRKFYLREDAREAEVSFHKANAAKRLKGEWFDMSSVLAIQTIEASFEEYDRKRRAFIDGDEL